MPGCSANDVPYTQLATDLANNALPAFSFVTPNLTDDKILARFCESPPDIWRRNPNFWHGSIHSGQMDAAQTGTMRPVPGWADYKMPIPGLYQTGATTHPGGSVSAAPGRNTAIVLLEALGGAGASLADGFEVLRVAGSFAIAVPLAATVQILTHELTKARREKVAEARAASGSS